MASPECQSPRRWAAAIFLIGSVLYLPSVSYEFTLDDLPFLQRSQFVRHPSLFPYLWTRSYQGGPAGQNLGHLRPVTMSTFAATWWGFGDDPAPFHAGNAFLHGLNGTLLFLLARRWLASESAAAVAALAFALHPIHVEAVVNVVGRAELLVMTFGLLAWRVHAAERSTLSRAVAAGGLYLLALLSKANALPLVAMFAADDWLFGQGMRRRCPGEWWRGRAKMWSAHVAALAIYFAVRWAVLGEIGSPALDRRPQNPLSLMPLGERLPTALSLIALHWRLFLWPHPLRPDHSFNAYPLVMSPWDTRLLVALVVITALVGLALWGLRCHRGMALAVVIYAAGIALTSNIAFTIGHLFAERNLYLPSAGVCLMVGAVGGALWRRWPASVWPMLALAAGMALGSAAASRHWASNQTLFARALETTPASTMVWANRAAEMINRSAAPHLTPEEKAALREEAEAHAARSLSIWPGNIDALHHLAQVALLRGDVPEAARRLDAVLAQQPAHAAALARRAAIALAEGETARVDEMIERALAVNSEQRMALTLRVRRLVDQGRGAEAVEIAERLVERYPFSAIQWQALAEACAAAGDHAGAEAALREVDRWRWLLEEE